MLESLREFAAEQLASQGETEETRARHAAITRPWRRSSRQPSACRRSGPGSPGRPPPRGPARRTGSLPRRGAGCLGASSGCRDRPYDYTRGDLGHGQALVDAALPLATAGTSREATAMMPQRGPERACSLWAAFWPGDRGRPCPGLLRQALELSEGRDDMRRAAIAWPFSDMSLALAASGMRRPTGISGRRRLSVREATRRAWRGRGTTLVCSPGIAVTWIARPNCFGRACGISVNSTMRGRWHGRHGARHHADRSGPAGEARRCWTRRCGPTSTSTTPGALPSARKRWPSSPANRRTMRPPPG